jgi:MoxR-like ATPase
VTSEEILKLQDTTRGVYVDDFIKQYVVTIIGATRDHEDISLGSSPRGSLALFRAAQAQALIRGRDFVLPDDVKELAVPVLSHRIFVSAAARMRGVSGREVTSAIVDEVPVPGAQAQGWFRR